MDDCRNFSPLRSSRPLLLVRVLLLDFAQDGVDLIARVNIDAVDEEHAVDVVVLMHADAGVIAF